MSSLPITVDLHELHVWTGRGAAKGVYAECWVVDRLMDPPAYQRLACHADTAWVAVGRLAGFAASLEHLAAAFPCVRL